MERGYNLYQANCAQCHGANGEGGKGPALNRQDKLFAHLNPDYLDNILHVGGRYACGNPNSIMPIWANTGNPPGPLNYKQIEDVIAFIRAEKGTGPYRVMDPDLFEPVVEPGHGRGGDVRGLGRPELRAGPRLHAVPGLLDRRVHRGQRRPGASGSPGAQRLACRVRHGHRREPRSTSSS